MTTDTMMDLSNVDIHERPPKAQRISSSLQYEDLSDAFEEASFGQIDFEKQYASAYFVRLESLRSSISEAAAAKWVSTGMLESSKLVGHIKNYKSGEGCIALVGILFKDMKLKPSVLQDIQDNIKISDQFIDYPQVSSLVHKVSDDDVVFLEDMEARLQLVFADKREIDGLPTGVVIAVLGHVNDHGFFEVRDFCLPGYVLPEPIVSQPGADSYVAIVSGLMVGSPQTDPLALQLLRDFLLGTSAISQGVELSSRIARLIVAGDSLYSSPERDPTASALSDADIFFAEIASVIPVDIMSGPRDPTNYCMPQQPLHSGLLPEARRYKNLTVHTNPYKFKLGSLVFLGTSGQNVSDVVQYTNASDGLEALDLIARSRYLAPTAPDTLGCYPFTTVDPMVIRNPVPHVLFTGNQMKTGFQLMADEQLCIASIADFSVAPSIMLINTRDFKDTKIINLNAPKD
jgi:DNA polymerase delta subunit 2